MGDLEQQLASQLIKATKVVEEQLDSEIHRLENMKDDDLEALRQKRMEQMKQAAKSREQWLANGHGKYEEIPTEKDFFDACKKSKNVVCHFYRDSTFRCKIVDKHLAILAPKHVECRFLKLNAEKAPFLTQRLSIRVIPTITLVKDEKTKDFVVGFDDLGGHDEFSTEMMEWRIAQADVINYSGDLLSPPDMKEKKSILGFAGKNIRSKHNGDGDLSDDNDW